VRKEAAIGVLGCAISAAIVLWSLHGSPMPPPPQEVPQEAAAPLPCAWWVQLDEVRTGCSYIHPSTLLWLSAQRNDDGSYGSGPVQLDGLPLGKTGLTALVLLPFLGAGYSPLSKDVYVHEGGDWHFGKELKRSLEWLVKDQLEDGRFRSAADGTLDQILAPSALSEVYGQTEGPAWKQPAQRAADRLLKMQKPDGTWGGAGPTAWAIIALHSARLSEVTADEAAIERVPLVPGIARHPGDALARVLRNHDAKTAAFQIIQDSRGRKGSNVAWWYLAVNAMWCYGGTRGAHWWEYKPGRTTRPGARSSWKSSGLSSGRMAPSGERPPKTRCYGPVWPS
jgi:hypothetical protein